MVLLDDVLDTSMLDSHVKNKYVRSQVHPDFPELMILNYTEACTWDSAWDPVTLACRGLIVNTETMEVLARPFTKFFNYGQAGAAEIADDVVVRVTEKMDGSMGILYKTPDDKWAIATRGSFASDQALWATEWFNSEYGAWWWKDGEDDRHDDGNGTREKERGYMWEPSPNLTYIFEIIAPWNRIVVDYGDKEALVLLGVVNKLTGKSYMPHSRGAFGWPGEYVDTLAELPFGEVVANVTERKNKEGFVLWHEDTDARVKVKHEEYIFLHRLLTNTNKKDVWEVLSTYKNPNDIFALAPDEFHEWLRQVSSELKDEFFEITRQAHWDLNVVKDLLAPADEETGKRPEFTRKDFAAAVESYQNRGLIFKLLEGRNIDDAVWKLIKPRGDEKMTSVREVNPDAD